MKILIMSDLHFEFHADSGRSFLDNIKSDPDVCIVAGDLSDYQNLETSIKILSKRFKRVVYTYGNHEAYNGSIDAVKKKINKYKGSNFHFLDNSFVEIEGYRFIGCCLWFPFETMNVLYHKYMTDFRVIKNAAEDIYASNRESVKYLNNNVMPNDIVITHHLPSQKSIGSRWRGSNLNRFFLCEMDELILEEQPKLWIHGHTHDSFDYNIGFTRVLCNPLGYVGVELNKTFEELEIEL